MVSINSLMELGANVELKVTPEDLKMFAQSVVEQYILMQQQTNITDSHKEPEGETYLNTKQVKELLHVSPGTLNTWAKRGYLTPVKVGGRNMYPLSAVKLVQSGRGDSVANYVKQKGGKV